jgi:hypothetical protein
LFAQSETQYVGANLAGKLRVYLGGVGVCRKTSDTIRDNGYKGFVPKTETGVLPGRKTWSGANKIPLV